MKLLIISILIFTFAIFEVANGKILRADDDKDSCDKYIDDLIEKTLEENFDDLEPFQLQNISFQFEQKILLIVFKGYAGFSDGLVYGLSTLQRNGDCKITRDGEKVSLDVGLVAGKLDIGYTGKVSFMDLGPQIRLSGTIDYVQMRMLISKADKSSPAQLDEFKLEEFKNVAVSISGLGFLNKYVNLLINPIISRLEKAVKPAFEWKVKRFITDELPKHELEFP